MKQCSTIGAMAGTVLIWVWGCGGAQPEATAPVASAEAPATASASPSGPAAAGASPADAPPVTPSPTGGEDARTMDVIAAVVKEHRKEARACYETARQQVPGLQGNLVIQFTLKPSGAVKHAELNEERSTIREASVSTCVIDVITHIQFPKSSKGMESTVNYPFNFNP